MLISFKQSTCSPRIMESKICRVCLDRTATISLFDVDLHDNMQYCEKLMKCVTVVIEEGDGLPDAICESCASELALSYEFSQKCVASDRALRCLGMLQAHDLKEEKHDIKDEPTEHSPQYTGEALEYDDYTDHKESKYELDSVKNEGIKTSKKLKKCLPNHLRKIKHRVYSGPIKCKECGRVSKCQSAFELHMRKHTKEKPFICDICQKSFSNKSSMKYHINRHYGINDIEQRKLRPVPDWDGRRRKQKSAPSLCVICGLKLNCRSALETHMRTHTGDKPFTCKDCNKSYSLKGSLMRHMAVNHNKNKSSQFICEHCGKKFYTKTNIIIHLRIHTGERPYQCPFCNERFVQISSLIRHKRCHTGEKPFTCQTCSKAFRDKSILKKHQAVHSEARDFICHVCSKGLKTKEALRAHIVRHNNPEKYICNFCGTAFTVKGNLTIHVRRMHSEKSGICTICHKSFPNLPVHMRFHSGEKPFVCKLCNQGFATQRSLTHHIGFKHRDAAKFKCTTGQCDKAFPLISMLEFHVLKAHLDTTPYICQHCARGFLRPCDLSRHLKMNHMETTHLKSQFIKTIQIDNA